MAGTRVLQLGPSSNWEDWSGGGGGCRLVDGLLRERKKATEAVGSF